MSNIKYTSDGKKVLVVGKLNAEQTIVQEIFVSSGQEIPSGENFVVKSLHDQPAESWKEKNLRELELRYEKSRKTLEAAIDQQASRLTMIKEKAKLHADTLFKFVANSNEAQLDLLKKVMSGQITHIFVSGYSPEIFEWTGSKAYDIDRYNGRVELKGIKLLSLFGYSEGDLEYRLHTYRDGSGGSEQVFPVCSYNEALALAQTECDAQAAAYLAENRSRFSMPDWQKIEGIVIPKAVIEKYEAEADAQRLKRIENLKKELQDLEEKSPTKDKPTA
ncbi:hypothetical protein QIT82_gp37 [Pseudomonas phage psageK9]|uniref:Uncharacterized protein n=1 Tax=Pseudomonas phage psageK9 TaxID=2875722 RepID=A0AAE8XN09_9CAUD|nr:hypothetical protein QIT82_gp37 [Pseudomonas phage psageK9]UAW53907.1 hypothetical protein psageK9_37c [Pseudomonas phage psageK9]